jgi:hypothetical protein
MPPLQKLNTNWATMASGEKPRLLSLLGVDKGGVSNLVPEPEVLCQSVNDELTTMGGGA